MLSYYRNMIDWKEDTCIISKEIIERNLQIYEFIFLFLM